MAAGHRASVPGEQRVFSLVLALVASPEGLTKRELLSSVYGYAERYVPGERSIALERQFERDKEQLRTLGIPIDTLDSPLEPGNTQLTRYRISKDQLQVPADVRFDERELMLLRLAAFAWSEGSLSAEARRAAMKLESLGASLDVQHLGLAPRLGIPEPQAPALQRAIDAGKVVRFGYQLPERDAPLERRVAPLRLHRADGRWHLIAWDLERDADRVFLLSRIVGEVRIEAVGFDPELAAETDRVVAELLDRERHQRAVIDVRHGSTAAARLVPRGTVLADPAPCGPSADAGMRREADALRLEIGTLDFRALAGELAGYGAELAVVGPQELRDEVIARLRRVAAEHGADRRAAFDEGSGAHA